MHNKTKVYEAIQKNFAILKGMSDHQGREHKLLARQNKKMKAQYEKNAVELKELKETHRIAMEELVFLREKDAAFASADMDKQMLVDKIEALEREVERQAGQLEDNDFNIRVLKKENEQFKSDALNANEIRIKAVAAQ